MGRTATKAQEARARARAARLALLVERNAQDERIEEAVAAALLAWEDRAAAQAQVEQAERDAAAALRRLGREKVLVRDMATLTGIAEPVCARLLKLRVDPQAMPNLGGASLGTRARRIAEGTASMPLGERRWRSWQRRVARPGVVAVGTGRRSSRCRIRSACGGGERCPGAATDASTSARRIRRTRRADGTCASSRIGSVTPWSWARPRSTPCRCLGTAATTRCASGSV